MRVALTFDDGPSEWTPAILDLLAEAGAHATFFVLGKHALGNRDALLRMVIDGHEVGNHTYSHVHLSTLRSNEFDWEITETRQELAMVPPVTLCLWRAPYLDVEPWMEHRAEAFGFTHVGCDIDTADWMLDDPQRIADAALRAKDGDIILMHDGIPPDGGTGTRSRQPTVDALRIILRQPWEFLTVSELWA